MNLKLKRLVVILVMIFPIALAAQQGNPSLIREQSATADSAPANAATAGDDAVAALIDSSAAGSSSTNAPQQPAAKASQSSPPPTVESRPKIPGSMVGYVDDAVVASQIRIRFDAGFKDNAPDRAEFFYPQCGCNEGGAPGPKPGASNDINFQQLYLQAEFAPVSRFSVFTEVPFRWIQPQSFIPDTGGSFSNQSGISDVRAGFKLALTASSDHSLTLQFKAYFPSGDGSRGLGTAHYSFEPSLLYYQQLSERWAIESQVGGWHPINGSSLAGVGDYAGDIFFYGFGPSYQLVNRENIKFAPVVELFGWYVLGGRETLGTGLPPPNQAVPADASGTSIVNLKIGARTSFGRHSSIYVGFGQAVTHEVWYEHIVRAEYRYTF